MSSPGWHVNRQTVWTHPPEALTPPKPTEPSTESDHSRRVVCVAFAVRNWTLNPLKKHHLGTQQRSPANVVSLNPFWRATVCCP